MDEDTTPTSIQKLGSADANFIGAVEYFVTLVQNVPKSTLANNKIIRLIKKKKLTNVNFFFHDTAVQ